MTVNDLDVLLGSWELTGRTHKSDHDDVTGVLTATRILDGGLLQLDGRCWSTTRESTDWN
ncbi:hypothetical protein [Nocardia fluminea]|uniref:hypothetical protein n=1 Tax=Nocardia fluminea TaxID=134984 RepID=UPI003D120914